MAGAGYKLFNTGDVLTAAQVNTYLQEQTVMVFASSTARTTALSGVLAEGMVSYLQDTNAVEVYNGSAWVGVSGAGDVTEVQAGTGISVASGTGPIPVVTNTMATAINAAGDLIYGTANDTFTRLGIGTAGQVLKVNSGATAPEWGAASSGLTLITTASFSNVADTGTTFDGVFTSTYENYYISINEFYGATSTADLHFQYRYAGPTTQAATYQYRSFKLEGQAPTTQTLQGESAVNQFMMCDAIGNNAGYGVNGWVDINKLKASSRPFANWRFYTESEQTIFGGGYQYTARTYTGFLLKASTGNVYGTVSVYGLAK